MEHMGTNFSSIISGLKSGNNLSSVRRELFSHLHPLYDKIDKVNALTLHSFDRIGRQSTNVATYSNGSYVAFLEEALSLIPKLLKMSSCSDDTLIKIFDMYNLCICCLEAVSPPEHNTFDFRGIYNHWKKYEEAKLEGMQLLESRGINFGGPAIPERGREDDILILTISVSVFKSVVLGRSPDENDYHRLLTILDKIRPRFRSITDGLTNEKMFAVYLSKCALIMVEEVARYDGSTALALCEKVFLNFQNLSMNDGLKKFGRQICDLVLSHWDHDDEPPLYSLDILIYVVDAMAKRCKSDDENSRLAFLELVEYCVIKCPFQVVVHLAKKEFLAKVEEQFYKEKIQPLGYITSFYVSGLLVESTLVDLLKFPSEDKKKTLGQTLKALHDECTALKKKTPYRAEIALAALRLSFATKINDKEGIKFLNKLAKSERAQAIDLNFILNALYNDTETLISIKKEEEVTKLMKLCSKLAWKLVFCVIPSSTDGSYSDCLDEIVCRVRGAFRMNTLRLQALSKSDSSVNKLTKVFKKYLENWAKAKALTKEIPTPMLLIKQCVEIFCKVRNKVATVHSLWLSGSLCELSQECIVILLEQELSAFEEMEDRYKKVSKQMQKKIEKTLSEIYLSENSCSKRSRNLIQIAKLTRLYGSEALSYSVKLLSKAINLMNSNNDGEADQELLAEALFLRFLCSYEADPIKKFVIEDAQKALEVWERLDAAQCAVQTLPLLYNVADLLSLKGYMKLHSKIYMAVIRLLIGKEISLEECLGMLWRTRSLSHALCNSPIDDSFINELVDYDKRCAYEDVWIHGMRDEGELLVGFKQRFFLFPTLSTPRSIDPNKTQLHDDVCKAASNLLENDPPSNSSSFVAAHMYYDLGERMCAEGLTVKACYYAKKALTLRREIFVKYFRHSPDADNTYYGHKMGIFVHPRRAIVAWSWDTDAISLNECLLTPWNVLKAFLESKLQAAKMEELVGNGSMEQELLTGKTISSLLDLPIFTFGFSSALGNFYMGQARWNPARGEINKAKSILKDLVCCWKCKLVCKATAHQNMGMGISMDIQNGILQTSMTPLNARESYRIARKELVQSKWNVGSVCVNEKANAGKMKFCGVLLSKDSLKDPSHIRGQETVENDGDFSKGECWHCLSSEIMESNSMQGKIDMQWEFIRRRLLLRQLIGLANLHICGNDDDELHPDLARSIYAIGSRNTFLEINIEDSIAFLAMLIKEEIKADMFAVEQASFLYNICWLSLKRIWNKVARNNEYELLDLPIVEAGLKLSFILCREVPPLFQKVSRLLAVFYTTNQFPKLLSSPSLSEKSRLAAFFHQASIGAGFNNKLFCHLRKQKDHTDIDIGSSGPSSTSLRLAPKSVANFDTFIQIFYEDLPCVPTICVSIFSHDFSDLLLPKQCKAWVMVSRLMSKRVPAVVLLPIFEVIQGELVEEISTKLLDAKDCDKKWCCRWGNSIIDDVAPAFKNLIRDSFVTHKITQMSESNLKAWHAGMKRMEIQLAFLLRSIEESWFGSWKHLLLGDFPENGNLELLLEKLEEGCFVIQESKDRTIVLPEPTDETVDREPVILVLGSECQMLPWESLPIFKKQNQEAYRMPSVASIMHTLDICRPGNGEVAKRNDYTAFPICDPGDACYLLNTADIPSLQNHFRDWLKNHYTDGWTVFGSSFTLEKLMDALKRRNLVVYIGHGAEIGCIRPPSSGIIDRWPAGFLVACSSAALKFKGSNNPNGVALDFLVAGSPFVVGMLWDQPVLDQYNIVELVLDEWISTRSSSCRGCTQCKTDLCRHRKTIAACLEKGRQSCVYTHAVGAGVVCYGVPTYIYKT